MIRMVFKEDLKSPMGIYKILIGDYFYIGRSVNMKNRIDYHQLQVNNAMVGTTNSVEKKYIKIAELIKNTSESYTIYVEVVSYSPTSDDMCLEENKILGSLKSNPFCINSNFASSIYRRPCSGLDLSMRPSKMPKYMAHLLIKKIKGK